MAVPLHLHRPKAPPLYPPKSDGSAWKARCKVKWNVRTVRSFRIANWATFSFRYPTILMKQGTTHRTHYRLAIHGDKSFEISIAYGTFLFGNYLNYQPS